MTALALVMVNSILSTVELTGRVVEAMVLLMLTSEKESTVPEAPTETQFALPLSEFTCNEMSE